MYSPCPNSSKLFRTEQPCASTAFATYVAVGALRETKAEGLEGTDRTDRTSYLTRLVLSSAKDLMPVTYGHNGHEWT